MLFRSTDFTYNQDGSIRYEVLAGLGYELFAFDKINNDINHLVLNPILCEAPETSPYAIETYDIQINDDELSLLIDADEEINYIYSGYGYKEVLDIYIEEKGIEYMVFLFGQRINREQFNTPQSWPVFDDSVYSLYLIGIDKDGNQIIKHSDFQRNNTQSSSEKRFNQSSRQNICLKSLSNQTSATNAERVRTRKENLHPSK